MGMDSIQVTHFSVKSIDSFDMRTPVVSISIGYNTRGLKAHLVIEKDRISPVLGRLVKYVPAQGDMYD